MNKWLERFAYRIALHPLVFVAATGAVLLIASLIAGINASRVDAESGEIAENGIVLLL